MKLFCILEQAEEFSAGSSPSIYVHIFSSEENRNEFISKWNKEKNKFKYNKDKKEENKYSNYSWTYWLEKFEQELNSSIF